MWLLLTLSLALAPTQAGPAPGATSVEPFETVAARPPQEPPVETRSLLRESLEVLHDWDARREQAWAASDRARLARLYAPGSSAGRADVRLLRAYAARRLVVRRLETQVFAVRVLRSSPRQLILRVFDRVAGGEVSAGEERRLLPSTSPAVRDVTFRRLDGQWLVSEVSARGPGPRGSRR